VWVRIPVAVAIYCAGLLLLGAIRHNEIRRLTTPSVSGAMR
jgi:hypothetical protein